MTRTSLSLLAALVLPAAVSLAATAPTPPAPPPGTLVDGFSDIGAWKAAPSAGVTLGLSRGDEAPGGSALRLEFDFRGHAGWAAARRSVDLDLAGDWVLTFQHCGSGLRNDLEVKLVDASGENVWWARRLDAGFPRDWEKRRLKKRHFEFAWGPSGGGVLTKAAFLEITVTAREGGKGLLEVADLRLERREAPGARVPPSASATSSESGHPASAAIDGDPETFWRSARTDAAALTVDLGRELELGGLVLDWGHGFPSRYTVELADNGGEFVPVREVRDGNGGRDHLMLPEREARFVRLRTAGALGGAAPELRELTVKPLAYGASPNAFFLELAKEARRGRFPRAFTGEQSYWTVLGVDGDREEALLSEDGALEPGRGSFSLEPFLFVDGRLLTWADVTATQALAQGDLPIPSVTWTAGALTLTITAVAHGEPGRSAVAARYLVSSRTTEGKRVRLFLAVRPYQVNPPWQFLGVPGGVTPIRWLARTGDAVRVNLDRFVVPRDAPSGFAAFPFDAGDVTERLERGTLSSPADVNDPFGYASGALAFDLDVPAGGERDVVVSIPLGPGAAVPAIESFDALRTRVEKEWRAALDRVEISLPREADHLARVLRTNLAYVLVNRDGASIQPGSRSYERSWIRDGALTSEALLRLGHEAEAKEFLEWFGAFVGADGRVPCCVDRRGADAVPENDSHGQLLFLTAEVVRYTGDRELAARLFPKVEAVVAHLEALRQTRRTAAYRTPEKLPFFGLLPESISHEGYSAKPMHSYWDDFFALRGLADAAWLADLLGKRGAADRFRAARDEMQTDVLASLRLTMERHGIDYLPGCAELGDFDATSTTAALSPGNLGSVLPRAALERTFERYWENVGKRDRGEGEAYTPYELRAVGAFLRLGWRERALALLDRFLADQRPAAWNQWAEVVWRDPRAPKFIGDMPHTWVGSDFIRSFLDVFALERGGAVSLVVGAGVPERWARTEAGASVKGLRTAYGPLDAAWSASGDGIRVRLSGALRLPAGGIAVASPLDRTSSATLDGSAAPLEKGAEVFVRRLPAEVVFLP